MKSFSVAICSVLGGKMWRPQASLGIFRKILPVAYHRICNRFVAFWLAAFWLAWDKRQYFGWVGDPGHKLIYRSWIWPDACSCLFLLSWNTFFLFCDQHGYATEMYIKIGDVKALLDLHVETKHWDEVWRHLVNTCAWYRHKDLTLSRHYRNSSDSDEDVKRLMTDLKALNYAYLKSQFERKLTSFSKDQSLRHLYIAHEEKFQRVQISASG